MRLQRLLEHGKSSHKSTTSEMCLDPKCSSKLCGGDVIVFDSGVAHL